MLKKITKNEKGQAMVEFALITPLLILLLCGIIDFGWIFGNQLILNNAGRDTARYMSINYDFTPGYDNNEQKTKPYITSRIGTVPGTGFTVQTYLETVASPSTEKRVKIVAFYDLPFLTPLLSTILGDSKIQINTETTMRIE